MKQRVQIARMLAMRPEIMLMDEPFAALDAQTRHVLQRQLVAIWSEVRRTAVYVTHDIREALNLGQRIVLMTAGPAAGVKREYRVDLAYPRDQSDATYIELLSTIGRDIEEEVTKVWA
jgi:NitT/TauT family transport system ATP-binding protein